MDISVSLPLDGDGFLRRKCPTCGRQFKWHNGPANEEAEEQTPSTVYFCPLCSVAAPPDAWLTPEQLAFVQESAMPVALRAVQEEFGQALRGNKHMTFKPSNETGPSQPPPLAEADDMFMVASPCHAFEPVKVPLEARGAPLHCLVCGAAYRV